MYYHTCRFDNGSGFPPAPTQKFRAVLESPFAIHPFTAIPPSAALCESSDWLLLFLIGLFIDFNLLLTLYSLSQILSTTFLFFNL